VAGAAQTARQDVPTGMRPTPSTPGPVETPHSRSPRPGPLPRRRAGPSR
jgi:hypothetical protein